MPSAESWQAQLELELSTLSPPPRSTTNQVTELLTEAVCNWASRRGLSAKREFTAPWLRLSERRMGRVDLLLSSPSGRKVAVEIDRANNLKSLAKLSLCRKHGLGALWLRWGGAKPPRSPGVDVVHLKALRSSALRTQRGFHYLPRELARQVACPRCQAAPGYPCYRVNRDERISCHRERHALAATR